MNAVQILRQKKVIHRDIKLDNIFIDNDVVVIADFGLCKSGYDNFTSIVGFC